MGRTERNIANQSWGLLPLLVFMFLDNYFSYLWSFLAGVTFCVISLIVFRLLKRDSIYQFFLLPAAATLIFYAIILCLRIEPVLFNYSPLVIELLLVFVLSCHGLVKPSILRWVRNPKHPLFRRTMLRVSLNEFFYLEHIVQSAYSIHLLIVLFYNLLPVSMHNVGMTVFLFRQAPILIGVIIIIFQQIRISMLSGSLKKEMWLPVLNEKGKVIGCIARSVSRALPYRHLHPVVRIAVVCEGMLFLSKRRKDDYVSPDTFDVPYDEYVLFHHSVESTVKEMLPGYEPNFLTRHIFENKKVKHFVYLYVMNVATEEELKSFCKMDGKLWTTKQIEDNIGKGFFSDYFEQEFPLLKDTVLLAANFISKCN